MLWLLLTGVAALIWVATLVQPWLPWTTRESLDAQDPDSTTDLSQLTVLIPARNEADTIETTLRALTYQGPGLNIILIDDQSDDGTAEIVQGLGLPNLKIIQGQELPPGWSGKLWALEQGRQELGTPLVLLLDADIELRPGTLAALLDKMQAEHLDFISLMAHLRMQGFWEKLLLPAFIYYFKLIYPFRITNHPRFPRMAAAAGGCILTRAQIMEDIGGFHSLREALIDDCTLAARVKQRGYRIWLGLTHSATSHRDSNSLGDVWHMVARTAFTQLHYSTLLLLVVSALMVLAYWVPLLGLWIPDGSVRGLSLLSLAIMVLIYQPTLRYYGLSPLWALAMPVIGSLYLAMTWTSALRYWRGHRSSWKARVYDHQLSSTTTDKND
jgi:hopene-associated glycosyltransferase HpnB